jgi:hypothetical protein
MEINSMTKANLIKLLDPYRDDQEIVVKSDTPHLYNRDLEVREKFLLPFDIKEFGRYFHWAPDDQSTPTELPINVVILK